MSEDKGSIDARILKLGMAARNLIREAKPFIEDLVGADRSEPAMDKRQPASDPWRTVPCDGPCGQSILNDEAIIVSRPNLARLHFSSLRCLMLWSQQAWSSDS